MNKTSKRKISNNKAAGIIAASVGSFVNILLGFSKLYIGLASNSVGIISDGINNFGDVLGCSGAAVGLSYIDKAPDERHPNGYGKVEHLVTFVIAQILLFVGCMFTYFSIDRLIFNRPIFFTWLYFGIIAGTMVVKLLLFFIFRVANKKLDSDILKCESVDCLMDTGITAVTLIGYIASLYTKFPIDALIGLAIGSLVIIFGIKTIKKASYKLIG